MNAHHFRRDKTVVLGAIKVQLPFSEGKYQPINSWNKIPFPTDQIMLTCTNISLKGHETIRESRKLHSKPFYY